MWRTDEKDVLIEENPSPGLAQGRFAIRPDKHGGGGRRRNCAMAILAMLGHGRDARGTSRTRWRALGQGEPSPHKTPPRRGTMAQDVRSDVLS